MANQIRYAISAVNFTEENNHRYISHVIMHEIEDTTVAMGIKYTRVQVLQKLDANHRIQTMRWSYQNAEWTLGANVGTYTRNSIRYLRSQPDASVSDNLDNLLPLANLGL